MSFGGGTPCPTLRHMFVVLYRFIVWPRSSPFDSIRVLKGWKSQSASCRISRKRSIRGPFPLNEGSKVDDRQAFSHTVLYAALL